MTSGEAPVAAQDLPMEDRPNGQLLDGLRAPVAAVGDLAATAWTVGVEVAGQFADDVDRNSRFPFEAVAELKRRRILSALVPEVLGGGGAGVADVAGAVRALAAHCASTALVLAMHSIEVSNLVRHGNTDAFHDLLREVSSEQLLLANANSEVGIGGDVGRSLCALEEHGPGLLLQKDALAISYGEYADAVVATARRSVDAEQTDQVQVVCRKSALTLEPTSTWDAMGLRGTCSRGFRLVAEVDPALVYPIPFATIASTGGLQAGMILLSAVWVGLAEAAAAKAHTVVRAAARKQLDTLPPSALRLAELAADLQQARSLLAGGVARYSALEGSDEIEDPAFIADLRALKVSTSELAVRIATAALSICGIAGYRRDTPISLDRHIRDAHGGLVMVSNERYLQANAQLLVARKRL
jgi:acyl-CoA dehydrogenase